MWKILGRSKCPKCEALEGHVSYLQKLVDNLLAKQGMGTIVSEPPEPEEPSEIDKLLEDPNVVEVRGVDF